MPLAGILAVAALLVGTTQARAAQVLDERGGAAAALRHEVDQRNRWIVGASSAALLAYGYSRWWSDGVDARFKSKNEGWFGRGTDYGGIDKLGHAFSNYAGVRLLAPMLRAAGNNPDDALRWAGIATLGTFAAVELLDGFSREHAFSWEDLASNLAGGAAGLLLESSPRLDALLDFRFGYRREPTSGGRDPFGDYEGQRFLLVLHPDALGARPLRWLEFSVGYGISGFQAQPPGTPRLRERYVGVSIDLSNLLADAFYGGQRASSPTQQVLERGFELFQLSPGAWNRQWE